MRRVCSAAALALLLAHAETGLAIDSYRYLHVSIETPWMIFLFLLVAVFVPFILMVVLMWWRPKHTPSAPPKSDSTHRDD
jgi:hypothetical protein